MLTISSASSIPPNLRRLNQHRHYLPSSSSELYRPRTILIEKPSTITSYGFSIQTYGFTALNLLATDESACSLLSLSTESTTSRKSSTSNSVSSSNPAAPIQLVTYVDDVQDKSPAWEAGLRAGSVILSVNDQTVEQDDHETLVKRISEAPRTQLKLVVIQQNINKQIALAEKLQQLHRQLQEKEEEFEDLCKQELLSEEDGDLKETSSPSPRLNHQQLNHSECASSSFCHDKIPLDWRQSVTNFAHQQNLTIRTLPPILSSSSSITSSKYLKNRPVNCSQRSMSLSGIVFPHFFRHQATAQHRRALSYDDLITSSSNCNSQLSTKKPDESILASGCSLAMDLSRSFERKNSHSSSSTINSEDERHAVQLDDHIKQFKWKLRINK